MQFLINLNHFLWNGPFLLLLLGTHLFFTFRLKFPQGSLGRGLRLSFRPLEPTGNTASHVTPYGALATTLAATLGTGNIVGVSTAVALGGPGAVLWCWITGLLGMATCYSECYLSVLHKERADGGKWVGGPMYVLRSHGLRYTSCLYAFCVILSALLVGCTTQSNSMAGSLKQVLGLSPHLTGMIAALLAGMVLIGGIRKISRICEKLVPFLALTFILCCLIILCCNYRVLPDTFRLIFQEAFCPGAAASGALGGVIKTLTGSGAIRYGVARGLYTNEAGMGTAAIVAASSDTPSPAHQALVSMTAVFWDTIVMCLLSGLVIVSNLIRFPASVIKIPPTDLVLAAFRILPGGEYLLTLSLAAFALTTLIGWSYLGERCAAFLWGEKAVTHYHLLYIVMIYAGAVLPMEPIWECSDLINGLLLFPSLLALWMLRGQIRVT